MLDRDWSLDVPLGNFLRPAHIRLVDRASINPKPPELHHFSVPSTQHGANRCCTNATFSLQVQLSLCQETPALSTFFPLSDLPCWTCGLCLTLIAPLSVFGEFLCQKLCISETLNCSLPMLTCYDAEVKRGEQENKCENVWIFFTNPLTFWFSLPSKWQ